MAPPALRLLAAAVVLLAVASCAFAVNNAYQEHFTIDVEATALAFAEEETRAAFCAGVKTAAASLSCQIHEVTAFGSAGAGVTVTVSLGFATDVSAATKGKLDTAFASAVGGLELATGGEVAVAASTEFTPEYVVLEILFTSGVTDATEQAAAITAIDGLTGIDKVVSLSGTTPTKFAQFGATAYKVELGVSSFTLTKAAIVTLIKAATTTGGTLVSNYPASYVFDMGVDQEYTIVVGLAVTGTTATALNGSPKAAFVTALQTALGGYLIDTTPVAVGTVTGTTTVVAPTTIKTTGAASAAAVLELLHFHVTSKTTLASAKLSDITMIELTPALAEPTTASDVVTFQVDVANVRSFAPSVTFFRSFCDDIKKLIKASSGDVACYISGVGLPTTAANGAGGIEFTLDAASPAAALELQENLWLALNATDFVIRGATVSNLMAGPTNQFVVQTVDVFLVGDVVTATKTNAARAALCTALYANQPDGSECFIAASDVVLSSGNTKVTLTFVTPTGYSQTDLLQDVKAQITNGAATLGTYTTASFVTSGSTTTSATSTDKFVHFNVIVSNTTGVANAEAAKDAFAAAIAARISAVAGAKVVVGTATSATPSGTQIPVTVFVDETDDLGTVYKALSDLQAGAAANFGTLTVTRIDGIQFVGGLGLLSSDIATPTPTPTPTATKVPTKTPEVPTQPTLPVAGANQNGSVSNNLVALTITGVQQVSTGSKGAAVMATFNEEPFEDALEALLDTVPVGGAEVLSTVETSPNVFDVVVLFTTTSNTAAANLAKALTDQINSGGLAGYIVSGLRTTPIPAENLPTTPPPVTNPVTPPPPANTTFTSAVVDLVISGTSSTFTTADQTALALAVGQLVNGTATIQNIADTTVSKKFTVQANAVRVTMLVQAPSSQYPTQESIIARIAAAIRGNGRIGNSNAISVAAHRSGDAATRGAAPIAFALFAAVLVALLGVVAL